MALVVDYYELAELADKLFGISDEDDLALAVLLDALDPEVRQELLNSDFLNAFQVFCYYFRTKPSDIAEERLILEPASSLLSGVFIEHIGLYDLHFSVREVNPSVIVSDGESALATFSGSDAYSRAVKWAEEE